MDRSSDWFRVFQALTELAMMQGGPDLWCESNPDQGQFVIKRDETILVWATIMPSSRGSYVAVVCGSVDSKATHYFLTDLGRESMVEHVRAYLETAGIAPAFLPETAARLMA